MSDPIPQPAPPPEAKTTFGSDFRRFFLRGLHTLLPTLITLWLIVKVWDFLWENLGQHLIWAIQNVQYYLGSAGIIEYEPWGQIGRMWWEKKNPTDPPPWEVKLLGVVLAILIVYIVGLFVGNLIGRTIYRLAESAVMRVPIIRAIYPAVKQITDFLLADRRNQFEASRVVAVRPHEGGIWSIGLITGPGVKSLTDLVGEEMVTVFVPSSPTAFSGYVLVVPRKSVIELPLKVEEAMRLLVSGGVLSPEGSQRLAGMNVAPVPPAAEMPENLAPRLATQQRSPPVP